MNLTALKKIKFQKKTSESFGSSKISLTFASAFAKKAIKKSSLKRFRYKQASSTILTKVRKQKPSITYKVKDRFGS